MSRAILVVEAKVPKQYDSGWGMETVNVDIQGGLSVTVERMTEANSKAREGKPRHIDYNRHKRALYLWGGHIAINQGIFQFVNGRLTYTNKNSVGFATADIHDMLEKRGLGVSKKNIALICGEEEVKGILQLGKSKTPYEMEPVDKKNVVFLGLNSVPLYKITYQSRS
jgi:hypothetical protein